MALAPKTRCHGGGWKYTNTKGKYMKKKELIDELHAMMIATGVSEADVARGTGLTQLVIGRLMRGFGQPPMADLAKIHEWLVDKVRQTVAAAPAPRHRRLEDENPDLMRFLVKCELTTAEIHACVDRGFPISELAAVVSCGLMSHEEAAQRIRKMLADHEHQQKE
jgi:transcriptional regulator with XRE-family HTH domain